MENSLKILYDVRSKPEYINGVDINSSIYEKHLVFSNSTCILDKIRVKFLSCTEPIHLFKLNW